MKSEQPATQEAVLTIADYAFLSDCQTAALVARDGTIDWYCPLRFDAPSVFARLLDPAGGYWQIRPTEAADTSRSYDPDTLVLRTTFRTATGSVQLTDCLAFAPGARGHEIGVIVPHVLLRQIEGLSGTLTIEMICAPRFEYGLSRPLVTLGAHGAVFAAGPTTLHLVTASSLQVGDAAATAMHSIQAGEKITFALAYAPTFGVAPALDQPFAVDREIANTVAGWQSWAAEHQQYSGPYATQVRRSALVLQALTFQPSGAIIAAATTSLPEQKGGAANWDYRYVWLRDLSLTTRALSIAACPTEAERYFSWIARALADDPAQGTNVQIMFGITGERELTERTLPHLRGYAHSRPVRIGNDAWRQKQLDVLGEVVDAIYHFRAALAPFSSEIRQLVAALAGQAAARWHEPDAGMWEARDRERHYLSSKIMCWVALDRAIKLAPEIDAMSRIAAWQAARDAVRAAILDQGWNEQVGAYTGAFGSDELDASVLIMPLVDFLPASDERMRATIAVIERNLLHGGLLYRWKGDTNGFLLCSFWLVECLARAGEHERATELFRHILTYANDVGLMAEMADPHTGEMWGNFPQTFSHVGLINAAASLAEERDARN